MTEVTVHYEGPIVTRKDAKAAGLCGCCNQSKSNHDPVKHAMRLGREDLAPSWLARKCLAASFGLPSRDDAPQAQTQESSSCEGSIS